MEIHYSPRFLKRYRKLPEGIKRLAEIKEAVFRNDPFHPSLKTHKLTGELEGFWAFSVNYRYRIVFEFLESDRVIFHTIGGHDIY